MCKCRSHGTFPLFGLQSSHLNICYYHQDPLHRRRRSPGSFCVLARRRAPSYSSGHLPGTCPATGYRSYRRSIHPRLALIRRLELGTASQSGSSHHLHRRFADYALKKWLELELGGGSAAAASLPIFLV
ncbi:hypothetical protein GBA52_010970 [Prunus armeniaca]|nr:hypothetical protein GBA52_010970 [Prunus armeniaca]